MFTLSIVILVVVAIGNMSLGLIVYRRDNKSPINITFLGLVTSLTVWAITNFLTDNTKDLLLSLWSARLANFTALLGILFYWIFAGYFTNTIKHKRSAYKRALVFVPALLISLTPLGVTSITSITNAANQQLGQAYAVVILTMFVGFIMAIADFVKGLKKTPDPVERKNIWLIIYGTAATFVFAIVTNIFLPIIYSSWDVSRLGPLFTLFLVITISYGIARNKLFDIRAAVARSVAYTFTLITLSVAYGIIAFDVFGKFIFKDNSFTFQQQVVFTVLATFLVFTYQPLLAFFNRWTNRIFYRDSYDSQTVIDKLGTIFALQIDINKIAKESLAVIADEMKLTYARLAILDEGGKVRVATYGDAPKYKFEKKLFNGLPDKVTIVDEFEHLRNSREYRAADISAVLQLITQDGTVGYLILGPKKSGYAYSLQDTKLLTIISNEMAVAVQNSLLFERISEFNITLQRKVEEATRKLRVTNEKLKALDETKDDFISMASHQLRTPLTSIKGYLSMVLEGDVGKVGKQQHEMLNLAFTSSQRMVYIIADLLNVSRLKTGKFIIEKSTMYLPDIIDQELDQVEETARSREVKLIFKRPKDFPLVYLDETKTRQVIMNFIDNAIYYTPAGGHVEILLTDTPTSVEFRVKDNGLGVPKSDVPHLFTKFYRAGNARKARPDGTGLGLYMAKKVIVTQGGVIIFESTEGKGSIFGFKFAKDKVQMPSGPEGVSSAIAGSSSASNSGIAQKTTKTAPEASKKPQKTLAKAAK